MGNVELKKFLDSKGMSVKEFSEMRNITPEPRARVAKSSVASSKTEGTPSLVAWSGGAPPGTFPVPVTSHAAFYAWYASHARWTWPPTPPSWLPANEHEHDA